MPAASEKEKGHGRDVRWFKVLIRDEGSDGGEIRVTLPAALIELVLANSDGHRFKVDDDHCEIDLKACWKALKKAGPHALVEIRDDGAVFRDLAGVASGSSPFACADTPSAPVHV